MFYARASNMDTDLANNPQFVVAFPWEGWLASSRFFVNSILVICRSQPSCHCLG